jgi:type VI protein secretion system component Hcp
MPGQKFLLTLTLEKQGKITGSSSKGHGGVRNLEGMLCHSFNYSIESQIDLGKDQATGKRQHKPIVIVKEVDESSPLLFQALCTNEVLQSAVLTQQPVTVTKQSDSASPSLFQNSLTSQSFKPALPKFGIGTTVKSKIPPHTIELMSGTFLEIRPAGIIDGKRCEAVTVSYENLKVNGMLNGTIPHSLLG